MKATTAFTSTIKDYLIKRGSNDPLFAKILQKPGKNMDDCVTYILNTVKKSGCNGFADDEIYNMAVHYFDEDKIDVGSRAVNMDVRVNHVVELTEEEKKKAREEAFEREIKKNQEHLRKKAEKKSDKPAVASTDKKSTLVVVKSEKKSEAPVKGTVTEQTLW